MNYLKEFFDKALNIMQMISRESKRNNKFAQKTANELQEFCTYAQNLYLENLRLKLMVEEKDQIIRSQLIEMAESDLMKERELLKSVYRKYSGNEEIKATVKHLAELNVASLKYLNNGSK